MSVNRQLNPDAIEDLYTCCLNALGVYDALKTIGADEHLPGYSHCVKELKEAIKKAENIKCTCFHDSNEPSAMHASYCLLYDDSFDNPANQNMLSMGKPTNKPLKPGRPSGSRFESG